MTTQVPWKVIIEPEGKNPGLLDKAKSAVKPEHGNTGGLVIYLTGDNGQNRQEVSRVGYVRRNTKNPKTSFEKQLAEELKKANAAVEALNSAAGDGSLQ